MRFCVLVLLAACTANDQRGGEVQIPIYAAGTLVNPFSSGDGFTVEVTSASVAIGPFFFCAETAAQATCPTPRVALRFGLAVDALDPTPRQVATVIASRGPIRSVNHDYGISWPMNGAEPTGTVSGLGLDSMSARIEGFATQPGTLSETTIGFLAEMTVPPPAQGSAAVSRNIGGYQLEGDDGLLVVVDVQPWLRGISFGPVVNTGSPARFAEGSSQHQAVLNGMTSLAPPQFQWNFRPAPR